MLRNLDLRLRKPATTLRPPLVPYGPLSVVVADVVVVVSLSSSLRLSRPTTALRKLVNPARETARALELPESKMIDRTPHLGPEDRTYTHTHIFDKGGCEPPTVIRSLLDSCAFPAKLNVVGIVAQPKRPSLCRITGE